MTTKLTKSTVPVLNRNWQAINVRTPQEAFCLMATNVATGLESDCELPTTGRSPILHSSFCTLRSNTVPKKRPKLCARAPRRILHSPLYILHSDVWSAKDVNQRKADRLPHEAGLRLLSTPRAPKERPAMAFIRNSHDIADWKLFVQK
ncbi:MAG TPA: HNH endonuclease [Candidatus Binatia bacterium]|jgi:hypothetical protein|nr:HNH endonuclease [Candidatus Binatia bacterium]